MVVKLISGFKILEQSIDKRVQFFVSTSLISSLKGSFPVTVNKMMVMRVIMLLLLLMMMMVTTTMIM